MALADYFMRRVRKGIQSETHLPVATTVDVLIHENEDNESQLKKVLILKDLEELQSKNLTTIVFSGISCIFMPKAAIALNLVNTAKIYSMAPESVIESSRDTLYHFDYIAFQAAFFVISFSSLGKVFRRVYLEIKLGLFMQTCFV